MKILIVQLRRVGDILLTTPVVNYLKTAIPDAQIDFLCEPMGRAVLETHPGLRRLLIYDKKRPLKEILQIRKQGYDVVLDFLNNPRTRLLTFLSGAQWRVGYENGLRSVFYNIRARGLPVPEYVPLRKIRMVRAWLTKAGLASPEPRSFRPELNLSKEDETFAASWAAQQGVEKEPFFVAVPAHRHPVRAWRADGFREICERLCRERGWRGFVAWGPGEEKIAAQVRSGIEDKVALLPPTNLRQMAAILKRGRLVVTNDSGAMHLSVAVGTRTVTIYGPTRPVDWNPSLAGDTGGDIAIAADGVDCLGCQLNECPVGHLCMERLDSKRVYEACERALKESSR